MGGFFSSYSRAVDHQDGCAVPWVGAAPDGPGGAAGQVQGPDLRRVQVPPLQGAGGPLLGHDAHGGARDHQALHARPRPVSAAHSRRRRRGPAREEECVGAMPGGAGERASAHLGQSVQNQIYYLPARPAREGQECVE